MLKQVIYRMLSPLHRRQALAELAVLEKKLISTRAQFAIPFAFRGTGEFKRIEPRQNPQEIERLYEVVCELKPQRVLEVGTARGGTLYLWTRAATEDALLVSVDLPGGKFGGAYPPSRVPFYQTFARARQTLKLIRADSHAPETEAQVRAELAGAQFDFAFIDGDHTYEGVKQDFHAYSPMVKPGGLVAFHDILHRDDASGIEVDRFWNEIKTRYRSEELIGADGTGRRIGIGLIWLP